MRNSLNSFFAQVTDKGNFNNLSFPLSYFLCIFSFSIFRTLLRTVLSVLMESTRSIWQVTQVGNFWACCWILKTIRLRWAGITLNDSCLPVRKCTLLRWCSYYYILLCWHFALCSFLGVKFWDLCLKDNHMRLGIPTWRGSSWLKKFQKLNSWYYDFAELCVYF